MSKKATAEANSALATEALEAAKARPEAAEDAAPAGAFGDLDKVRSILFGAQSQQIEQRFAALESRLEHDLGVLREAVAGRFDKLEAALKKEHETFTERLKAERQQRAEADRHLDKELQALARSLQEHRNQLDDTIAEMERKLRAQLDEQAKTASQTTSQQFEALSQRLEEAVADLRNAKTDRTGLADLLDQLSAQLRKEA